jgi:transcriptional regulator with XRE-family HTH domain
MVSLITIPKAQKRLAENLKNRRLSKNLTQQGLSERSGVSLPTLRKFEQKGLISLESLLKLAMVLDFLGDIIKATEPQTQGFSSIDDVLNDKKPIMPKRGRRK